MSEEKIETKAVQPEGAESKSNEGIQPSTGSLIDRADTILKRAEESEKRTAEYLKRIEDIEARRIINGRADAGTSVKRDETEDKVKKLINSYYR